MNDYNPNEYYSTADHTLVCAAHQALARRYRANELDALSWYWTAARTADPGREYHRETVGPYTLHSGPFASLPLPLVCIYLDSQIKTYMDRDALGDAVRSRVSSDEGAIRAAREKELARRVGGGSLEGTDLLIAMIEYNGYVLGGMLVIPGIHDETVGSVMQSRGHRPTSITALQAKFTLPPGDPFLTRRESEIAEFVRYFRAPDHALEKILPPRLLEQSVHRKAVHLIRALTISEAFAVTTRWMIKRRRWITTGVCETPNDDVKALIEGRKGRVDAIPHRVLTRSTGAELYPDAYQNRPEGTSKIYALYAFDFAEVSERAKRYREVAVAAYGVTPPNSRSISA
jgi:hypothetical protein